MAGEIVSVGKNVKTFKNGDRVFGLTTSRFGAHAEYICIPETGSIAIKPANISYEEAAAICDGAYLALANIKKIDFRNSNLFRDSDLGLRIFNPEHYFA
ncbi:MAG: hypothetical protein Q8K98_04275 [Bacteroidota bacterium]|nr:hypothetical protein [Bacteroidota bacterium]